MHTLLRYAALCLFLCLGTLVVHAQGVPVSPYGIDISVSSNSPIPGQNVTITARSFTENINSATIVWTVDGREVKRGVGATVLDIQAPALGKKNRVVVTAILASGGRITGEIILGSGSIDLIVETDGYTHPLFMGKMYPSFQNTVKIIAVPHLANSSGVEYDPKTLTYQWKKDDQALEGQSGYGKQSVDIDGGVVPRPYTVTVSVSSRDGTARGEGIVIISPEAPELNFYVNDPLYGLLLNKALGNQIYLGKQRELNVLAMPWGFNKPRDDVGNLLYSWTVNGSSRPDLSANESIVLRAPAGTAGSSDITLQVRNTEEILQGALSGFSIFFAAEKEDTERSSVTF